MRLHALVWCSNNRRSRSFSSMSRCLQSRGKPVVERAVAVLVACPAGTGIRWSLGTALVPQTSGMEDPHPFDLDRSRGKNAQVVSGGAEDSTGTRTPTAWFLSVLGDCGGRLLPGRDQAVHVGPVVA